MTPERRAAEIAHNEMLADQINAIWEKRGRPINARAVPLMVANGTRQSRKFFTVVSDLSDESIISGLQWAG